MNNFYEIYYCCYSFNKDNNNKKYNGNSDNY